MKKILKYELMALAALLLIAFVVRLASCGVDSAPRTTDPAIAESTADTTAVPTETTAPPITWATYPAHRQLTCKQAFVYDCAREEFVFTLGQPTDRVYAASITKLFTAYVALQYLQAEQTVTAGDVLDLVGAGSSVAEIEKGDILTVEQLIAGMLLPSGNDAAYILAAEAGWVIDGDKSLSPSAAVGVFVKEMNRKAQDLGMTGTNFENPDGYHTDNHYTCFKDLAIIGKLSLEIPQIPEYATAAAMDVTFQNGTAKTWKNTNALVDAGSPYYCPLAVGLKTGQTPSAGSCLLSAFDVNGRQYIIGVFGCPDVEDRFDDTLQLLNTTLENGFEQ